MSCGLVAGGLASGGCLPTDDLTDYSEQWSDTFAGSGGSGSEEPAKNGGAGGSPTGMQLADAGSMPVDMMAQGGLGGTPAPSGGDDAGLDAGVTGIADAAASALPDACADAAPESPGCGG